MTLSYIAYLEARLRDAPPKQKGQRTRERLKIATAKVLEQCGYHAMRVIDITQSAELAEGSFYVYFKDKTEATLEVLTALLEEFFDQHLRTPDRRSPLEAVIHANRQWIAICRANAGLMRCILQVSDEEPEFARLGQRTNRKWHERVGQSLARHRVEDNVDCAILTAYMLGSMMDEIVRKLVVYPDPEFEALLTGHGADDNAIADCASLMWLRVLYPEEALPRHIAPLANDLARWLGGGTRSLRPSGSD